MVTAHWSRRALAGDVVAGAFLMILVTGLAGNQLRYEPFIAWRFPASVAVAGALAVALVLRRRFPVSVLVVVGAGSVAAVAFGVFWDPFLALALALYTAVQVVSPLQSMAAVAASAGAVCVGFLLAWIGGSSHAWLYPLGGLPLMAVAWVSGRAVRAHREQTDRLEQQREQQILADERLRIAREVHDVLTHGMGLIAVRSGVALHLAQAWPAEARETVRVIEETSKHALVEMRRLLHMLREDADLTPAPGIDRLADLAGRAAMAEVEVDLSVSAEGVPESVGLNAYRIVQEALTNVVKHAAPARCQVSVIADGAEVRIEVADNGSRPAAGSRAGGHGLVGMKERVAMYGGEFTAGPRPEGGFRVSASLPYLAEGDT
ncbi:signal transduction histidine kinase [Actinokineospora baliensis]|uniref:sensor histidine kinase n=1 Tax=Actinokineospora baliensis TaxID=547056 RepID=UPI001958CC7C|nr:sensor histidine kinase [Actinokineospora baliensis]MBM7774624.1 signal transduction histidine kinase [Actinokineospora baliensis]